MSYFLTVTKLNEERKSRRRGEKREEREGEEEMRLDASWRDGERSEGEAPGPMNPRPPAEETATASLGPAITFMGAPIMRGDVVHG